MSATDDAFPWEFFASEVGRSPSGPRAWPESAPLEADRCKFIHQIVAMGQLPPRAHSRLRDEPEAPARAVRLCRADRDLGRPLHAACAASDLRHLYNFTFGGLLSLGMGGSSISGMKYAAPRVVAGITASLFLEDKDLHFDTLQSFNTKDF